MVLFQQKIILLIFTAKVLCAKVIILLSEEFEDCGNAGERFIDWSGLQNEYVNDTKFYMTGK